MAKVIRQLSASAAIAVAAVCTAASAQAESGVTFTIGAGARYAPSYFGADHYDTSPTAKVKLNSFSLQGMRFGSNDPNYEKLGPNVHGSFRLVGGRNSSDYSEIAGLDDVTTSLELGLGLGYQAPQWGAFADMRYGVVGHNAVVAEIGADWKPIKTDNFKLSIGPRVFYGSGLYNRTYFGISPSESTASGLAAYSPDGGLVSTGLELSATYQLGNDWAVEGKLNYDRLQGDAADSPIVQQGSREQSSVSLMLTRRVSFPF
ncbi:MipA/OmpV family protein [Thioclava electrotropha]|uniref:MipA/OmpV family protein n=1 Tax=Thioclava electrotropha TaxID=1549850 RepID=A0ABX6YYX2_9RHOB|nr:MipA/OmpV family protein [Thioclava electrotropha]QPZ92926.1 MipA/OmpV family protein [Thioclava electrotropha]